MGVQPMLTRPSRNGEVSESLQPQPTELTEFSVLAANCLPGAGEETNISNTSISKVAFRDTHHLGPPPMRLATGEHCKPSSPVIPPISSFSKEATRLPSYDSWDFMVLQHWTGPVLHL